jgi:hypothetical protein
MELQGWDHESSARGRIGGRMETREFLTHLKVPTLDEPESQFRKRGC